MYADARIFTVIQLRNYLGGHKVLAKHPASYRQAELYKLYAKHLADRPRLDPHKFDWPAPAELTIFGLRWALDQYELSYDSGTRREDLEQLYVDLKTHQYDEGAPKRTRGDGLPFLVKAPSPLVKVLPPRARPAWLKRQHTRKIESEEQSDAPQPHPLRRSPRINATNKVNKNNSTSTLLTTMDETHRDVTTGKKGTARRTDDNAYPSKRPRVDVEAEPVQQQPERPRRRRIRAVTTAEDGRPTGKSTLYSPGFVFINTQDAQKGAPEFQPHSHLKNVTKDPIEAQYPHHQPIETPVIGITISPQAEPFTVEDTHTTAVVSCFDEVQTEPFKLPDDKHAQDALRYPNAPYIDESYQISATTSLPGFGSSLVLEPSSATKRLGDEIRIAPDEAMAKESPQLALHIPSTSNLVHLESSLEPPISPRKIETNKSSIDQREPITCVASAPGIYHLDNHLEIASDTSVAPVTIFATTFPEESPPSDLSASQFIQTCEAVSGAVISAAAVSPEITQANGFIPEVDIQSCTSGPEETFPLDADDPNHSLSTVTQIALLSEHSLHGVPTCDQPAFPSKYLPEESRPSNQSAPPLQFPQTPEAVSGPVIKATVVQSQITPADGFNPEVGIIPCPSKPEGNFVVDTSDLEPNNCNRSLSTVTQPMLPSKHSLQDLYPCNQGRSLAHSNDGSESTLEYLDPEASALFEISLTNSFDTPPFKVSNPPDLVLPSHSPQDSSTEIRGQTTTHSESLESNSVYPDFPAHAGTLESLNSTVRQKEIALDDISPSQSLESSKGTGEEPLKHNSVAPLPQEHHQHLDQSNRPNFTAISDSSMQPDTIGGKMVIDDPNTQETEAKLPLANERLGPLRNSSRHDWIDPNGKITMAQIRPILTEFGVAHKASDSKGTLLKKYKLLVVHEQARSPPEPFIPSSTPAVSSTRSSEPSNAQETRETEAFSDFIPDEIDSVNSALDKHAQHNLATLNNDLPGDWPDPNGKVKAAKLREILENSGIAYQKSDSKLVLLAKYKLLLASDQPRYNLRPSRCPVESAENSQPLEDDKTHSTSLASIPILNEFITPSPNNSTGNLHIPESRFNSENHQIDASPMGSDITGAHQRSASPPVTTPNLQTSQRATVPLSTSSPHSCHLPPHHTPEVANWVSGVFMANNDLNPEIPTDQHLPKNPQAPPECTPSLQAILSTLSTVAQSSVEIGKSSMRAINLMAEGFANLNSVIGSLHNTPAPSRETRSQHAASGPLFDINNDAPTGRRRKQNSADLLDTIRKHCETMFGRAAKDHAYVHLPPATPEEQSRWIRHGESDDEPDEPDIDSDNSDTDMDEDGDSSFPYPNGPGHPAATREALKIIRHTMRKAGIQNSATRWTFNTLFRSHIEGHLMRTYRENKKWSPQEIAARNKNRRKNSRLACLKRWRTEEIVAHSNLVGLIPVVEHCCSDDETDDEYPARPTPRRGSSKIPMRAKVLQLSWRSALVERIMIGLDLLRARRLAEAIQKPANPPPRVRRRAEQPNASSRSPKVGLPILFYDEPWIKSLSTYNLQALKTTIQGPPLDAYVSIIENLLLRT
ncbi:hypothetical protein PSHT_14099 [Puccinia striiformis]|uniref:Uncharacterized protein n=2 Tax=Puccinia striiformis TaxID=27350 RepID=A0A2S4ULX0_9BASI|nr:hypothetical protein PSHT_14099 [Puccinia striiformis]